LALAALSPPPAYSSEEERQPSSGSGGSAEERQVASRAPHAGGSIGIVIAFPFVGKHPNFAW